MRVSRFGSVRIDFSKYKSPNCHDYETACLVGGRVIWVVEDIIVAPINRHKTEDCDDEWDRCENPKQLWREWLEGTDEREECERDVGTNPEITDDLLGSVLSGVIELPIGEKAENEES